MFRYKSISTFLFDELLNRYIYFCKPLDFNDPLEFYCSHAQISAASHKMVETLIASGEVPDQEEHYEFALENFFRLFVAQINDMRTDLLEKKGVCCFSETDTNNLLWSHYANGHRGVCIEYNLDKINGKVIKVNYFKEPFEIPFKDGKPDGGELSEVILSTKKIDWEYEREIRLYHAEPNKRFYHQRDSIKSITFGLKTSADDAGAIGRAALSNNPNCKFYKIVLPENGGWDLERFNEELVFDPN